MNDQSHGLLYTVNREQVSPTTHCKKTQIKSRRYWLCTYCKASVDNHLVRVISHTLLAKLYCPYLQPLLQPLVATPYLKPPFATPSCNPLF